MYPANGRVFGKKKQTRSGIRARKLWEEFGIGQMSIYGL